MRDILFRGKRVDNGEWVEGNFNTVDGKSYINDTIGDLEDIDYGYGFALVYPDTVGQYTGLKDKNGVKIFEGDEVRLCTDDGDCYRTFVEYQGDKGYPAFEAKEGVEIESNTLSYYHACGTIEVTSNIHDKVAEC